MNLGKSIVTMVTVPIRFGFAAAETSLNLASAGLRLAKQALGDRDNTGSNTMASMLGIEDALARANRLARLLDDDAPLGRAIAPEGPVDRLLRPGGLVDLVTAPGGLLDRLTEEGGGLQCVLQPGKLANQLLATDRLIERILSDGGLADRLLSEDGLIDKLTAKDGPLEQLTDLVDTLGRLTPGMEALEPTIATLQDAVSALTLVVNPLSNMAERIPLPHRSPRHPPSRSVRSQRVIDADE
ncbi:hypothetical protein MUBE_05890 [Mycobacterium uberis]|uniref:Uncharacterized protein n=1 Tax=Mycobacterium uberis TaxID=2162698 RepID=A0A3E1HI59_9MYCO|nr:hypothetical protein [Mycobacterium uberis]RFD26009.1 hypothetical protein MUBE_05890 [Mycobacterium uberis]